MADKSPSMDNYRAYVHGKAKLKNALLIQPGDKINDFMHKHINHRFWVNDYDKFKKETSENIGVGMGNPVAPTPTHAGSGDDFQPRKRRRRKVNESFGDGTESFESELNASEIDFFNEPKEFGESYDISGHNARLQFTATIELSRWGIEGFSFHIRKLDISFNTTNYSPEDTEGDNPIEDLKEFSFHDPEVDIEIHTLPFYPENLEIDMHHTVDHSKWTFRLDMGRDHYGS